MKLKNMFSSHKVRPYLVMTTVALFASGVVISTSSSDIQVAEAVQVTDYDILSKKIVALETELNALKSVAEVVPVATVAVEVEEVEVEELTLQEKISEKNSLLREDAKRLTEQQQILVDLADRVSFEGVLAIQAAVDAELTAETEATESEEAVVTVEQRILDVIQEMQSEGALHEGEFYTTSGNWVKITSSKNDKVSTWDPTIWGKVGWNPHKQTWVEGYVGGWVHSRPAYIDPLSSDGLNIQSSFVKQSLKDVKGWHIWNDNSLNVYEVAFKYKDYNKYGDDGCFFHGMPGNSEAGCTIEGYLKPAD